MNRSEKVLFLAHSKPSSYVYRQTQAYLRKFPFVDIRAIAEEGLEFPKCVEELTVLWLFKAMDAGLEENFLKAVRQAQDDGYGAAASASAGDFSLAEAQSSLSIPYVGLAWASYWGAAHNFGRFSHFHTHMAELIAPVSQQQINAYGFASSLVSIEYIDVDIYSCLTRGEEPDYQRLLDTFVPKVQKVAALGAKAVTIGCGSPDLSHLAHLINEISVPKYGVRVLPPIDTVVEVAKSQIDEKRRTAVSERDSMRSTQQ